MSSDNSYPPFNTTFVISESISTSLADKVIDRCGCKYLADRFGGTNFVPDCIMPIKVPGDGNCALSSILAGIIGLTKAQNFDLREAIVKELEGKREKYQEIFSKCESFNESIESIINIAKIPNSFLGFAHFFAACNLIRRPIIVLSSQADHDRYGEGENGAEVTFLPFMIRKEDCVSKFPILISWNSNVKVHFVPLCPLQKFVEMGDFALIPRPSVAFWKGSDRSEGQLLSEYLDFGENLIYPPLYYELEEIIARLEEKKREEEKRKEAEKERLEKDRKEKEEKYLASFLSGITKIIEEESKPINVSIRTGNDILKVSFPRDIDPLETAKKICKDYNLPPENAKIISDEFTKATRRYTYPTICDSPIRAKSGVSGSVKLGIPAVTPVRYIDEPNPKVKKECTSYFKRINLFDYFVKVANLDAIERCFIIGSIHVMDEAFVNDVINTDYRRFVECLALCAKFKLPYYVYDCMKVAVLHPAAGGSLASWFFVTRSAREYLYDDIEFYGHFSLLKYIANFVATESVANDVMDIEVLGEYLSMLSSSKTPEILNIVASVLLNVSINYPFEDFGKICLKIMIKLLTSENVGKDTADVLLTALGTMFVNDKNALRIAKKDYTDAIKRICEKHAGNPKSAFISGAVF